MPQHVFFLGVTGYLGGSLLASLIQDDNYEIIALVRSQAKAHWLAAHNITPVIGDLNSLGLLEEQASLADIVINTADSDHVPSTITTLLGLQKRYKQTGKKPLYLHTSGTGILIDSTNGTRDDQVWSDTDIEALSKIPETALHRSVDMFLLQNCKNVELCIISPPAIYGRGTGDPELSNINSVQIPFLIAHAIRNGMMHQIGPGENVSSRIHVADLVQLYIRLLDMYKNSDPLPCGYLFPENGEHTMGDLAKSIATEMKRQSILATDEVVSVQVKDSELKRVFNTVAGKYIVGGSPRVRGIRARSTGWAPKHDDIADTLPLAVEEVSLAMGAGTYKLFGHNRSISRYAA